LTELYEFTPSQRPLLISVPHAGTRLIPGLSERLSKAAAGLPDTDWFVDRLYAWAAGLGAGLISANFSRYVIDLNRPPDDASLYSGKTTGLVPLITFGGEAIYRRDPPTVSEVDQRIENFHRPYHQAIESELQRLKETHGYAMLLDAHSICSSVPMLFDGRLPDLNLGSFDRRSAAPQLVDLATFVLAGQMAYSTVTDGRFKGGYITRHYGRPDSGIHALQLEMAQCVYMQEEPPEWDEDRAGRVRPLLTELVESMLEWGARHA